MIRSHLRKPVLDRERGAALIVVIGIGALLSALLATGVMFALTTMRHSVTDADRQAALAAAYGGIEEYRSRLAADSSYVFKGNPASSFNTGRELEADLNNPAFGINGEWAQLPGGGSESSPASFRYEVDLGTYEVDGVLRLRASGRVGEQVRTVVADLRQPTFINYVYFTDYEMTEPWSSGVSSSCVRYTYNAARTADCGRISFGNNDELHGRVHSNDVIIACDAVFHGLVTTAWNTTGDARHRQTGCDTGKKPDFRVKDGRGRNTPTYQEFLEMPQTNTTIRTDAQDGGCLYTGPTRILFQADGRMTVHSPFSKQTRPGAANPNPPECGSIAGLTSSGGATFEVPSGNAIYVQSVPDSGVNATPSWATNASCRSNGNAVGFPETNEETPPKVNSSNAYGCRVGDIFVEGTLSGQITLAAENYVYITGNTMYADEDEDLLGLIGNSMVWVHNPIINGSTQPAPIEIHAAILSLRAFTVQNLRTDSRNSSVPTLTVRGSIAQRYRGAVWQSWNSGWSSTGYRKDYRYDSRLLYRSPPHFLAPVTTAYGVSTWIETEPAFDAEGQER